MSVDTFPEEDENISFFSEEIFSLSIGVKKTLSFCQGIWKVVSYILDFVVYYRSTTRKLEKRIVSNSNISCFKTSVKWNFHSIKPTLVAKTVYNNNNICWGCHAEIECLEAG